MICKVCDPQPNRSISVENVYHPICPACNKRISDDFYGEPIGLKEQIKADKIRNSAFNSYLDNKKKNLHLDN